MARILSETIREITRNHLEKNNGLLFGQSITAVGWVNGTVPDTKNIIELPMCDVAGSGIAVGAAIAGRRPIFVIRYQDFIELGMSPIINYAAKSKEMLGIKCPIFIRLIADEGKGLGPVHSGKLHSIFTHFPGLRVCAPITSDEYQECWDNFMSNDDPMIVSEHRASYNNEEELKDQKSSKAELTILAVSIARFNAVKAVEELAKMGVVCNFVNLMWLKPVNLYRYVLMLKKCRAGLVVDTGFQNCGVSESLAYKLMFESGKKVAALGLKDYSVGCTKETENLTPSAEEIVAEAKKLL